MRPPVLRLHHDELIVDNFAGGGGASLGIEWALGRSPDIAVNHDPQAVALHAANHPRTKHFTEDVWTVDPVKVCEGRPVGLAWFSPDCKHFSKAKGGKPVSKKIRGLAWIVVKWARLVRPRVIALENVEEFQDWGPLGDDNRPDKLRRGLTFQRWKAQLENLGYRVEWRELVAADYGAPTTRKRLFLVARCDGRPIVWPQPTHAPAGKGGLRPWRAAAECIDWTLPCHSIFLTPEEARAVGVKRPLAENTMRRIYRGLVKFVIENPTPYIVRTAHGETGPNSKRWGKGEHQIDEPLPTVAASKDFAVAIPYIAKFRGDSRGSDIRAPLPTITAGPAENPAGAAHAMAVVSAGIVPLTHQGGHRNESTEEPLRTVTGAHRGEKALAAAYVTRIGQTGGNGDYVNNVDQPIGAIVSKNEHLIVQPFLAGVGGRKGQSPETRVNQPYHTITAKADTVLVAPVLAGAGGPARSGEPASMEKPLGTVLARNDRAIVAATLVTTGYGEREGQAPRVPGIDKPLGTIVAGGGKHALVAAFMAQHNGGFYDNRRGAGRSVEVPLSTITHAGSNQQLVASSVVKLKGTSQHGQDLGKPLGTVQAEGQHYARADAFLLKYYGTDQDPRLDAPMHTLTSRDRMGLVMVDGDLYRIEDIGMRMLVPRELYTAQGFPQHYRIEITFNGKPLPKDAQVRLCGNSVSPYPCAALVYEQFLERNEEIAA